MEIPPSYPQSIITINIHDIISSLNTYTITESIHPSINVCSHIEGNTNFVKHSNIIMDYHKCSSIKLKEMLTIEKRVLETRINRVNKSAPLEQQYIVFGLKYDICSMDIIENLCCNARNYYFRVRNTESISKPALYIYKSNNINIIPQILFPFVELEIIIYLSDLIPDSDLIFTYDSYYLNLSEHQRIRQLNYVISGNFLFKDGNILFNGEAGQT